MNRLLQKVAKTVQRHNMLPKRGRVALAVSGGPDSLALMYLMCELKRRYRLRISLHVGHLHHGMRGEAADEDVRFVQRHAEGLGLPCTVGREDVFRLARQLRVGVEVAGREARQRFMLDLARAIGARTIVFAHQADDQAETILMRVRRGAGPRGMGGIPYVRTVEGQPGVRVIRPLLDCSRKEILQYLAARKLRGRLDSTNLLPDYLRNRVRTRAVPALKRKWRTLRDDLCRLAALAQRLQSQADRLCSQLEKRRRIAIGPAYVQAPTDWLRSLPDAIQAQLVQRWLKESGLWSRMLSSRDYAAVRRLAAGQMRAATLPGGVSVRLEGDAVVFQRAVNTETVLRGAAPSLEVCVSIPGRTPLPAVGGALIAEVFDGGIKTLEAKRREKGAMEEYFDFAAIRGRLLVRFPRPGDRMKPLGAPGRRKLQDIFTDMRVPRRLRPRTPVVAMDDEPIWLVGLRMADKVKVTAATKKLLRLRFVPESEDGSPALANR